MPVDSPIVASGRRTAVNLVAPWSFESGPVSQFWSVGGFVFDLVSSEIVEQNETRIAFEKAQDINTIAFVTLKERFLKEMSLALSRLAVKKMAEIAARPKKDDKNKNEKEAVAFALQVFNFVSEKADTRNWQTLPHSIYYSRIPLNKGANELEVNLSGPSSQTIQLKIEGNGKLQLRSIYTLR